MKVGQTVYYHDGTAGIIIGFHDKGKYLRVIARRTRLEMAGTFPDKPVGQYVQKVREFWRVAMVSTEAPAVNGGAQ